MPSPLLAALTAPPGPHPPLAELRAYAAGTLTGSAAHHIEAHALACARCADVLDGLQISDAPTTDRALAELQQRLRQRVGELGGSQRPDVPVYRRAWPRLAAAAALVAGLSAGWWGWQHQRPAAPKAAEVAVVRPVAPVPVASPGGPAGSLSPVAGGGAPPLAAPPAPGQASRAARPALASARPAPAPPQPGRPVAVNPAEKLLADKRIAASDREAAEQKPASATPNAAAPEPESAKSAGYAAAPLPRADTSRAREVAVAAPARMGRLAKARTATSAAAAPASAPTPPPAADAAQLPGRAAVAPAPAGRADAHDSYEASAPRTRAALPPPPTLEPAPVGGYQALRTYLQKQAKAFAPESGQAPIKGLVRVRFTISAAGKPELEQAKILRSLRADYDAEVLRMLSEGPAWVPGVAAGRRAPLPVLVEVLF